MELIEISETVGCEACTKCKCHTCLFADDPVEDCELMGVFPCGVCNDSPFMPSNNKCEGYLRK